MYKLGDRIRELFPPAHQSVCRAGTVLIEYTSQESGLPLLSVIWDGTTSPELELPELVELFPPHIPSSPSYRSFLKGWD